MSKKVESTGTDKLRSQKEKKAVPVYVKFGLIFAAVIVAAVIGILIYSNVSGSYVATVAGEKIGTREFNYYLILQKQTMYGIAAQENPGLTEETFWATKIDGEDAVEYAKKQALEAVRDMKVQYIKAKEAKVSLTKEEISNLDNYIQTSIIDQMDPNKSSSGSGNKIRANKEFEKTYHFSIDDLRSVQMEVLTVNKFQTAEMDKIPDADADVEKNYSKHKDDWYKEDTSMRSGAEEAVWARHILISVATDATQEQTEAAKKKAEELTEKLKKGEDFATLAKENSEDPGSKDNGGEYLFGKGTMVEEFENAAFALKPGEFTQTPVKTTNGYHIIKLEEKYADGEPVSLRCAKEYNEYGVSFVKYKLYMEKVAEWSGLEQYKPEINAKVYNSIK